MSWTSSRIFSLHSALLLAVLPSSVSAQTTNQSKDNPNSDIIVRGQTIDEVREQTDTYVRETVVSGTGMNAMARWNEPVCPKVLNTAANVAAIVERKVRMTAQQIGVPVAGENCESNIVIAFSTDGTQLMSIIADRAPKQMSDIGPRMRQALVSSNAPIRWWHSTAPTALQQQAQLLGPRGTEQLAATSSFGGGGSILINTADARQFGSVTVIVDVNNAEGYTLDAVAAYVAMVSLAEVRLDAAPNNSILGLFTAKNRPIDLSQADIDFLRALYTIRPTRTGSQQRRAIVGKVAGAVQSRQEQAVE